MSPVLIFTIQTPETLLASFVISRPENVALSRTFETPINAKSPTINQEHEGCCKKT